MQYYISEIWPQDTAALRDVDALLQKEGLARDRNLDYLCGLYDDTGRLAAAGGCFRYMLRCLAVDAGHQGEGLISRVVSHLAAVQAARGNTRLFLHTKPSSAVYFGDLGFYEIARSGNVVFMENRQRGFTSYLEQLQKETGDRGCAGKAAAIVMNANPFTRGHQYLVRTAAAQCDVLHVFVVSEDAGQIPADIRKRMVREGTAHIPNVVVHDCGPYMISYATFPGYFLKGEDAVIRGQAELDVQVFARIAGTLGITARYVGDEPLSHVTDVYNQVMRRELEKDGIACHIVPRLTEGGEVISASRVRQALADGDLETIRRLVPETTGALLLR